MSVVIESAPETTSSIDSARTALSETGHAPADHSAADHSPTLDELFSKQELNQFARDDEEAGRRIGKILATLFIYTVIAMSVVILWTFQVVQ